MKKRFLGIAALLATLSVHASAAFENVEISIDSVSRQINVSAQVSGLTRNEAVKLIVLRPEAEKIDFMTLEVTDEKYTQNKKSVSFSSKLSANAPDGKYTVKLLSASSSFSDTVMYMSDTFLMGELNKLNDLEAKDIPGWISENAVSFEMDVLKAYESYTKLDPDGVGAKLVYSIIEKADLSVKEDKSNLNEKRKLLHDTFYGAVITACANEVDENDVAAAKAFLDANSDKLVIKESIAGYLESLDDATIDQILKETFEGDFSDYNEILTKYYEKIAICVLAETSHWTEVKALFENESDLFLIDEALKEEVGADDLHEVYVELVGKTYASVAKAVEVFNETCEDVIADRKKEESKPKPSGGGGGGGGSSPSSSGSGFGAVFTPTEPAESSKVEEEEEDLFTDLADVAWAKQYINELARQKVISGYGNGIFGPKDKVTRGQFARILTNAFGLVAENAGEIPFTDVPDGHIFKDAVATVYSKGIVYGVSENAFNPEGEISREDACTMIMRAFDSMGFGFAVGDMTFADKDMIAAYAQNAVSTLSGIGIVSGDGTNFNPKNSITRAELSRIICLCIEKITEGDLK